MNRNDTQVRPVIILIRERERESRGTTDKTAGQIPHDGVGMTVPNEQNHVRLEHGHEEPSGPRVGEVRLTEVAISHDEVAAFALDSPVQVGQPSPVASQGQRWSGEDVDVRIASTKCRGEMSVKVRRHHPDGRFVSKQTDESVMEVARRGRLHVYELTGPCLDIDAVLFNAAEIRIQGLGWPPI